MFGFGGEGGAQLATACQLLPAKALPGTECLACIITHSRSFTCTHSCPNPPFRSQHDTAPAGTTIPQ